MSLRVVVLFTVLSSLIGQTARAETELNAYLTNEEGEKYFIGTLALTADESESNFRFKLANEAFGDYFLSMRPFRCLEQAGQMLCYLPYPYNKPNTVSAGNMRPLEYDFLFIQRKSAEYGIDPWNGLYYKIKPSSNGFLGSAKAVDLNILASPPENGVVFPLTDEDLHDIEAANTWLPTLLLEEAKP